VSDGALRALAVLEKLASSGGLSAAELARELDMSRATVSRLLHSLNDAGWIMQQDGTKRFVTTLRLVSIASAALNNHATRSSLLPWLMELCERANLHCALCFYENATLTVTDVAEPGDAGVTTHFDGRKYPAACTAAGKILVAHQSEDEQRRVAAMGLPQFTPHTRTRPDEIWSDLQVTRAQGYGLSDREFTMKASGVSVPIFDRYDRAISALTVNIAGPISAEFISSIAPVAKSVGGRASLALGKSATDLYLA